MKIILRAVMLAAILIIPNTSTTAQTVLISPTTDDKTLHLQSGAYIYSTFYRAGLQLGLGYKVSEWLGMCFTYLAAGGKEAWDMFGKGDANWEDLRMTIQGGKMMKDELHFEPTNTERGGKIWRKRLTTL